MARDLKVGFWPQESRSKVMTPKQRHSYHFFKNWIGQSEGANASKSLPTGDWNDQHIEQSSADTRFDVL